MPIEKHPAIVLTDHLILDDGDYHPIAPAHEFVNGGEMHTLMYANLVLSFPPGSVRDAVIDTRMMRVGTQDTTAGNTRTYAPDMHGFSVKITESWETYGWTPGEDYEWQIRVRRADADVSVRYAKGWVRYE